MKSKYIISLFLFLSIFCGSLTKYAVTLDTQTNLAISEKEFSASDTNLFFDLNFADTAKYLSLNFIISTEFSVFEFDKKDRDFKNNPTLNKIYLATPPPIFS